MLIGSFSHGATSVSLLLPPHRQEMKLLNNALEDEKRIRIGLQVRPCGFLFFRRFYFRNMEIAQTNMFPAAARWKWSTSRRACQSDHLHILPDTRLLCQTKVTASPSDTPYPLCPISLLFSSFFLQVYCNFCANLTLPAVPTEPPRAAATVARPLWYLIFIFVLEVSIKMRTL